MDIKDLVPGRLYKAPFEETYFIFVAPHNIPNNIIGHYFSRRMLIGADYAIGNSQFWINGKEVSFEEVKDWMPEKFMPKSFNYEIY